VLFDTHCHLDVAAFDEDRDAVFARAHEAGVTWFLNPAYDLESSRRAVALAQAREDVVAAVGVHPNDAGEFGLATLDELRRFADQRFPPHPDSHRDVPPLPQRERELVVAIGEIGLDYHWKTVPPEQQAEAFIAQLQLARELNLPVIIHCRDAYDDCLEILREHGRGLSLVLHSFAGKMAYLRAALELGYHIGVGGPLTYPSAHTLRDCVKAAPIERIVLETDAPYLAPQGWRGKRNEPAYLSPVAERLADVKSMSLDDIARITSDNARRLFRLEDGNR
jgi:TatD DNase family protein